MGGVTKVVTSVVSIAVGFITRKTKSYKNTLSGVWNAIRDIWKKIDELWDKVKELVKKKLDPIIKWLKKLEDWYKKHLEPWIKRIEKLLNTYIKLYLAWKIIIERKITYLFKVVEDFLRPKVIWLDNFLRHLQQVFSIFSKKIANRIEQVRYNIWKATLGKLYELERRVVRYVHTFFVPIDRFVYGLKAFKEAYFDPLAAGLKGLEKDIDKIIDKDGAPRPIFSMNVLSTGWKEFWEEYLRFHPTPHVITPPPPVEVDEIYIELETISPDAPDKLPPEEKEIYEALEEEVVGF